MLKIGVWAGSQVMAASLAVTTDVLHSANRIAAELGQTAPFDIRHLGGPAGTPPGDLDCLALPGLGLVSQQELDQALASDNAAHAIAAIQASARAGAVIASSCASCFLLAESGILNGRRATTSWFLAPAFARRYPAIRLQPEDIVVEDGPVITGGAAMAQLDVMIRVVARFAGGDIARLCARYLLADDRHSQTRHVTLRSFTAADARLTKAEQWIRDNLARGDVTVEDIAACSGLHPKTFYRRLVAATGLAPSRFVQRVRLEVATDLLRDTSLSVDEIAARVGYADASTLRRVVRRELGASASDLRQRARLTPPGAPARSNTPA